MIQYNPLPLQWFLAEMPENISIGSSSLKSVTTTESVSIEVLPVQSRELPPAIGIN